MKAMKSVAEFNQAPPPGRYPSRIIGAVADISKKSGATMLHLTLEILAPAQFAGAQADDYLITDGTAKGAGMAKQKLRALGVNVDSDEEIPDAVLAQQLLNMQLEVEYGNEARQTRSREDGPFDTDMTVIDSRTGQTVVLQKLIVKNYHRHSVGGAVAAQPVHQLQAPVQQLPVQQQLQQAPVQYPQQGAQVLPGYPQQPQFQPQFAPSGLPQQGYPQVAQPGFAPQGYPQQGAPLQPGQFAPQAGVATPPWQLQQGAPPNGAAPAPAETPAGGKKRRANTQIQDT